MMSWASRKTKASQNEIKWKQLSQKEEKEKKNSESREFHNDKGTAYKTDSQMKDEAKKNDKKKRKRYSQKNT